MTRYRPSRRTITPPSTLTGVLRRPGRKRSLREHDFPKQEQDSGRETQSEREPEPGKAPASGRRDPPAREVDVQPWAPAPPVHREPLSVERENDVSEPVLLGGRRRKPDAVRDAAHSVERVNERVAAGVVIERVDPPAVGARRSRHRGAL